MTRKLTLTASGLALAAAYFVASALPAFSADGGTVTATVTPAVACLTLDTSSVDFGSQPFSTPSQMSKADYPGVNTPYPRLTNCGGSEATLLARGTNATGAGGAAWTLTPVEGNPCAEGVDKYHQWVNAANLADGTLGIPLRLSTTDQQFKVNYSASTKNTLGPGASMGVALVVELPCAGSTGAGAAMGFSYVFTATL